MKKYLITGFSGFVSRYFIEALESSGQQAEIYGIDLTEPDFSLDAYKGITISFTKIDLIERDKIDALLFSFQPDYILHLAAFSSVAFSWKNPDLSFRNNMNIFINLIESVRETGLKCRLLSVGSSEEYGIVKAEDLPLKESCALNPASPYAVARISQELLSKIYVDGFGLDIVLTRSFNHFGPRQKEMFAVPSFAKQIALMKYNKTGRQSIRTGRVDVIRDFIDVRDVVKAYLSLFEKGLPGEIYNVCSGRGISIKDIIVKISDYMGISVELEQDSALVRPNDNPVIIGDNSKLSSAAGWHPEISFEKSISDICDYWTDRAGRE